MEKKCTKCNVEYPATKEFFGLEKNGKYGLKPACKKCVNLFNAKYRTENKQLIAEKKNADKENSKEYQKEYYKKNKEKKQQYYLDNKVKITQYRSERKELTNESAKKYFNNKVQTNLLFKIKENIRGLIKSAFKRNNISKKGRTANILGCSYEELKQHLESKFESWMNWENHGLYNGTLNYGWDIDHIIPLSSAKSEEDIIKLNHYTNLQPLCSYTNRYIKKDKLS